MTPDDLLLLSEWLRDLAFHGKPASQDVRTATLHFSLAAEHLGLGLKLVPQK